MNSNYIEIIGLNYNKIIENLNIAFEKNKIITVSGPNNCGKTTLIRILSKQIEINNSILINNKKIEDYSIIEINKIIKTIIPEDIKITENKLKDELNKIPNTIRKELLEKFHLTRKLNSKISSFSLKEKIYYEILKSLITKNTVILIDDLVGYFNNNELKELIENIKYFAKRNNNTIIYFTTDLYLSLYTDYLYIINNKEIVIEGIPIDVLKKDNIINKNGQDIPFMVDLSVKLMDYELIDDVILNMEDLVNLLWK